MTFNVQNTAATVSTVDEFVMGAMPFVTTALALIPGAQVAVPFLPLVSELLGVLDNAAKAVSAGDTGLAIEDVFAAIKAHLTPGQPNSAALAP